MPFITAEYPTIGVPLLLSILRGKDIDCSVFYFAKLFRESCSPKVYESILADSGDSELSEWLFSRKTFGIDNDYLDVEYATDKNSLLEIRDQFESIIDDLSLRNWSLFDSIGFSCTFIQLVPSLCLSKHIKKNYPEVEIIFGGGNMLPELSEEVLKNCSWVDTIFIGEAEKSLPHYLKTGESDIKGIMKRNKTGTGVKFSGTTRMESRDIQDLPMPDFSDYFEIEDKKLSIQIGRGCIYNKCNFCVYCDHTAYRKGSIENSINHMKHLVEQYDIKDVYFVDLIIPPKIFETLPDLPGVKYSFCLSSFTWSYDHLPYLKGHEVTIGIESFHPEMLKLLNKEQSIIKCISMLKWLKYYDVNAAYLLLYGAVHEKGEWYDEQLRVMRLITHLQPPIYCSSINHHRDNTYLNTEDYKESSVYEKIYPSTFNLKKMARVFEVNSVKIIKEQSEAWSHIKPMLEFARQWRFDYLNKTMCLRLNGFIVTDTRYGHVRQVEISQSQIDILKSCDYPVKKESLHKYNPDDIKELIDEHLLMFMEDQYLNLVEP